MEEKKAAKTISPIVIFCCVLLVMAGFLTLRFPYVHPNHQYNRELFLYGNLTSCIIFAASLFFGLRKLFHAANFFSLSLLILGMLLLFLQLMLDKYRLDTHLGAWILLIGAAVCGGLGGLSAFVGLLFGRSLHDALLSIGVLTLLTVNLVLPEFTPHYGYKAQLCPAYLKGLMAAFEIYKNDYSHLPDSDNWCDAVVQECDIDKKHMCCPFVKSDLCSYAMNENIPADAKELPDDLVVLFESAPAWNQAGGPEDVVTDRHGKDTPGANIAFADGRVEFVKAEDIVKLRWIISQTDGPLK